MPRPLLLTLDDIEGADLPLVGGKAFRLAHLKQHRFNVPPGLVLTTAFFEAQLKYCQLTPLWAGSPDIAVTTESLEWLANTLKAKPISPELLETLTTHLERAFGPHLNSFAVRSSAVDEDQRDHTFAGVHLTELGVPRSALPIAITRCWASALGGPALRYRQAHSMSIQRIQIALLIQPMLSPVSAGVGFTVNPLTGNSDELVIEATWGLGTPLVSGQIQPYSYRLSARPPDYPLLERRAGNPPDSPPAGQPHTDPIPPAVLPELAMQLKRIQALMGEPQDVEWAWQDETLYFLQTRPVAISAPSLQLVNREWTRGSHPEFLPDLPSPLFSSLLERSQSQAITFFTGLGIKLEGIGPYIKLILGRPYLNLTLLKKAIGQAGVNPGSVLYTIGHTEPGARGGHLVVDWPAVWKARRVYWRVFKQMVAAGRQVKQYQALVDEAAQTLGAPAPPTDMPARLGQLRLHERLYKASMAVNLGLATGISALTAVGSALITPLTSNPAAALSAQALHGVGAAEAELNRMLLHLAQLARQSGPVQQYLNAATAACPDVAETDALPPEFKAELAALLQKFGNRAAYDADPACPRYADDPTPLLRIIHQYVRSNQSGGPHPPDGERPAAGWSTAARPAGLDRFLPWRRGLAALVVKLLRRLLVLRYTLNQARGRAMTACREWDLALGREWTAKGWLAAAGDIFWLTLDEIERTLMLEEGAGITLSSTVQARKETYRMYAQTEMPFSLPESQIAYIQVGSGLAEAPPADVLVGLPISPGQVQGTVVVVHSPDDFRKPAGEIVLVMPSTGPAWLPLLHLASGLIVETGGLLSHGSVIAREYGLPAVANIPQATKRFHTGDRVLVDGSTGIVQLLEPAEPPSPS